MKKIIFPVILIILFSGCSSPQVISYRKPGIDFSQQRKIALTSFDCSNPAIGQEVSDILAFSLREKGYDVIERGQIKSIIDEASLSSSGLTDENFKALKLKGVNSVVVGSVTRYDCEQSRIVIPTQMGPASGSRNLCHVSLSIKMLNVLNGDVIWAAQGSYSRKGRSLTAANLLSNIMAAIEPQIPANH